jgi:hypothetical protein
MGFGGMPRNPDQLISLSILCRDLAGSCQTDEARNALLEVAEAFQVEADAKVAGEQSLFSWQDDPLKNDCEASR